MLVTCKCLNVSIHTKSTEIQDVDISTLGLSSTEISDSFFQEDVCTVDLVRISKEQSSLVQVRNVENWIIHQCLNCSTNTHAINREKGAAFVLVRKALVANPIDVAVLKSSDRYSPVFRILLNHTLNDPSLSPAPTKFSASQLPSGVQTALAALQQQLGEAIQQETARTEERVRLYSEQQYAALEEFREHAHRDHRILARLLCESQESLSPMGRQSGLDNPELPLSPTSPVAITSRSLQSNSLNPVLNSVYGSTDLSNLINSPKTASGKKPSLVADTRQANRPSPLPLNVSAGTNSMKTDKRLPTRLFGQMPPSRTNPDSLDTEGLFDLEGMEENPTESFHSEEETDTDDSGSHDEGIHIPKGRGMHSNLAKSLPVNVPAFLPPSKRGGVEFDEEDDDTLPQDPLDIAASIKALAKSVHGEASVFGDLPRPRFSTQI